VFHVNTNPGQSPAPPLAPPVVTPLAVVSDPRSLPVAVFDSGVGGLTVLHECLVSLPHEDFLYLGDTARFPYGDRSGEELLGFARELAAILLGRGAKALVVACNSATAAALPALRTELERRLPLVAVVRPESRLAAGATRNGRVGLIATPATVASGAYARALAETAPHAELHAVASAELAPLIQAGGDVDHRVLACVEGACRPLKSAGVDTVILGCTHYPLVRPVLQRELGRGVTIVSSGEAIADEVETRLREAGLENDERRRGRYGFLATGDPEEFRRVGTRFLQLPIGNVEHVDVTTPIGKRAA
jgi:glutamate racemase